MPSQRTAGLTARQKADLRLASRIPVEGYFSKRLSSNIDAWLSSNNRYRLSCISRYKSDLGAGAVSHKKLAAYVAASGPAHAIDAWGFLAGAIDALFRGDRYTAIHLGYYCELRSAMSLLACEGIGVFSDRHPIIHGSAHIPTAKNFGGNLGTHRFVWPALRHWSSLQRSGILLQELIAPEGIALHEWLQGVGLSIPLRAVAGSWLRTWGLDLAAIEEDRNLRNLVSYRPSEFRLPPTTDLDVLLEFVDDLWHMFEPGDNRRFPNLERGLLRKLLVGHRSISKEELVRLGIEEKQAAALATFIASGADLSPIRFADKRSDAESATCDFEVIARAALLLSFATYAVRNLLQKTGFTSQVLQFWWKRHGTNRGIWDEAAPPDDPRDLWADVEDRVADARKWRKDPQRGTNSLFAWKQDPLARSSALAGFELAGIWGMIP